MDTIVAFPAMFMLFCYLVYYRRQSRSHLPQEHPRRQRARMLYYFGGSMFLMMLPPLVFGREGTAGDIFFFGFLVWFAVLCLFRKQIPKEADVLAYEAAHGERAPRFTWPREKFIRRAPPVQPANHKTAMAIPHPRGSREWALHELGLTQGATPDDIRAAYRRLMRMAHPDRGGDTEFAADLNLARETLLEDQKART